MEFRFIDDGTHMDIRQKNKDDAPTYYGVFEKIIKGPVFHVSCDPLYEIFNEIDRSQIFAFTFFRGSDAYTFDAKIVERKSEFMQQTLVFNAMSLLNAYSRRNSHRVQVQMPIRLFEKDDTRGDLCGALFCTGEMHDVSRGGLTFLSAERLNIEMRKVYMAEFEINQHLFRVPVEFVRAGERGLSPVYKFDYAFMYYDVNAIKEDLNRMTLALFEQQLKGRR